MTSETTNDNEALLDAYGAKICQRLLSKERYLDFSPQNEYATETLVQIAHVAESKILVFFGNSAADIWTSRVLEAIAEAKLQRQVHVRFIFYSGEKFPDSVVVPECLSEDIVIIPRNDLAKDLDPVLVVDARIVRVDSERPFLAINNNDLSFSADAFIKALLEFNEVSK